MGSASDSTVCAYRQGDGPGHAQGFVELFAGSFDGFGHKALERKHERGVLHLAIAIVGISDQGPVEFDREKKGKKERCHSAIEPRVPGCLAFAAAAEGACAGGRSL